jgi:ATP-dependent DNA helicase RecG
MQDNVLLTSIEFLKGVGPKRAELLKQEAGIFRYIDLLNYFPFRYIDKSKFYNISDINDEQTYVQLKAKIIAINELGVGRKKRLSVKVEDDTSEIELVWFKGVKWIKPNLHAGQTYIIFGRPARFGKGWNIAHPEIEVYNPEAPVGGKFQPVYHSTEKLSNSGLNSRGIEKIIATLLSLIEPHLENHLSNEIIQKHALYSRRNSYKYIHAPQNTEQAQKASFTLKFEELFFLQMNLLKQKQIVEKKIKGHVFESVGSYFNDFYHNHLPFELTSAQKRVVKEIRKDLASGRQMNRLLQGDVGSGKTLVALLICLMAADNGFQSCIMAPTEILAQQHYTTIRDFLKNMNINVALLTGSTKPKERTEIHENLQNGNTHILIGTHALLEDVVSYKNLGLAVVDEQHRFGVAQRAKLWRKNVLPPHMLIMTATPIPRTLAMTFYGDLDTSVIDELPPGRKPIKTIHQYDSSRLKVFGFLEQELEKGRQVYIVYPLIEESEKLNYKDLTDGFESISRRFPLPKYRVGIVHGRMKPEDKDYEMKQFTEGKTHLLVSTTVIEVGVNVPNASVMVIESAEKFGLSQLHQLRGRVGRGAEQSYCILMTDVKLTSDARKRLDTMVRTNDGFEISEVDLKLRGPGDIMGTRQSGILDLKIADLSKDSHIVSLARSEAFELLSKDENLELPQHATMRQELIRQMKNSPNWSRIS